MPKTSPLKTPAIIPNMMQYKKPNIFPIIRIFSKVEIDKNKEKGFPP